MLVIVAVKFFIIDKKDDDDEEKKEEDEEKKKEAAGLKDSNVSDNRISEEPVTAPSNKAKDSVIKKPDGIGSTANSDIKRT